MLRRKLAVPALLALLLGSACLTPDPEYSPPPDAELESLLDRLAAERGEEFAGEGAAGLAAEIERLPFRQPDHAASLVAAAALAYDRGDAVAAQRRLDRALALDPLDDSAVLLRARLAAEAGNLPLARRMLEQHVELRPDSARGHEALAGVAYLDGELALATRELELAERLGDPGDRWRRAYAQGLLAEARGDAGEAARLYAECADLRPDYEPAGRRLRFATEALGLEPPAPRP